ncbi:MAG: hypothetical protein ACOYLX_04750 [Burkholderiaceae bacterium]
MRPGQAALALATSAAFALGVGVLVGAAPAASTRAVGGATPGLEHGPVASVLDEALPPDDDQRLLVFGDDGALPPAHAQALHAFAASLRASGTALRAEACTAADDASGLRLLRAVEQALAEAGVAAWRWVARPLGCSLPGSVVLWVNRD